MRVDLSIKQSIITIKPIIYTEYIPSYWMLAFLLVEYSY